MPRRTEMFSVTQQLVAPTIAQWGTAEQRARYVRAMLRTDLIACQLFSETEAGSDLAAVRTRAVRVGRRITGCSTATRCGPRARAVADLGVAVCRTDPGAPSTPGSPSSSCRWTPRVSRVRPIRQMTGGSSFNEVYLDGVELDDSYRLGPVGRGLAGRADRAGRRTPRLAATSAWRTPTARSTLAGTWADRSPSSSATGSPTWSPAAIVQRLTGMRVAGAVVAGSDPGPEASVGQAAGHRHHGPHLRGGAPMLLGRDLTADSGRWGTCAWTEHLLGAPGYRIAGGTDEIQHNIIAERVLGLPRERRP